LLKILFKFKKKIMKKIYILLAGFMFTTSFAQQIILQSNNIPKITPVVSPDLGPNEILLNQFFNFGNSGIISGTNVLGEIIASADDIDLTYAATKITKIYAYGFDVIESISTEGIGVSFYIIADEDHHPIGSDPRETNLYAFEMKKGDTGLSFYDMGNTFYQFILDLNLLDENVILPAGKYWISVVANTISDDITGNGRWNWNQSLTANGAGGHITDPSNFLQFDATSWTDIKSFPNGWTNTDLAMVVEGQESHLGVSDFSDVDITVYPNPATNFIKATVKKGGIKAITVINMNGQVVATSNSSSVNVSALPVGVYLVKVIDTNGNITSSNVVKK
jgi:hypothetical protein